MSDTRLESMRNNPSGNWRIADIVAVCSEFGVMCEAPRGGGSHCKVAHPRTRAKLAIPFARPIVRRLVRFLDEVAKLT